MAVICVTGEWHQAIVLGAALADLGHEVRGAVTSEAAAADLNRARPPVHEPGLPELMRRMLGAQRLRYTASWQEALAGADYVYLSLDTPIRDDDSPDLTAVVATAEGIAAAASGDVDLVITAQVPVGTCERLADLVAGSGHRVRVAHVPEFLRLGQALRTFFEADRFIIGCDDEALAVKLESLYAPLRRPMLRMSVRSAEMTKHASNAFLAASISFANEIADLCEASGADMKSVAAGMKLDPRIGAHAFLSAGLGFAGGTLGRDVRALQALGCDAGRDTLICDAVMDVNEERPSWVQKRLVATFGALRGLRVCIFGLTYKPGTSTLRRSVALQIVRDLHASGVEVTAYDPLADAGELAASGVCLVRCDTPAAAARGADAIVLITEWQDIERLDFGRLRQETRGDMIIDTRGVLDATAAVAAGFRYQGIGNPAPGGHVEQRAESAVEVAS